VPDVYRGVFTGDVNDPSLGARYGETVRPVLSAHAATVGTFICESILSCAGQVVLPASYLQTVYGHVRAAGGVCIADEVQVGMGRVGSSFWAFETQHVVPDIVTIGKRASAVLSLRMSVRARLVWRNVM
jgi:4-aminobutyrate aminotransferase-like enzyme